MDDKEKEIRRLKCNFNGSKVWLSFVVGVYIWICVLDYLNKTQDSRSFGAKPPCQDLMKIS